jgi:hypothetical protein
MWRDCVKEEKGEGKGKEKGERERGKRKGKEKGERERGKRKGKEKEQKYVHTCNTKSRSDAERILFKI